MRTTSRGTRPVILKSIIALAHDLGMDVVAEGAETDSDAVELYQLGCEYAQGFAFGEPMDADARDAAADGRAAGSGELAKPAVPALSRREVEAEAQRRLRVSGEALRVTTRTFGSHRRAATHTRVSPTRELHRCEQCLALLGSHLTLRSTSPEERREVKSRVARLVRQHAGIDADLAQRAQVFVLDVAAEDQVGIGGAMQPAIVLDFVLELPRRPAGITERQDRVLRARRRWRWP